MPHFAMQRIDECELYRKKVLNRVEINTLKGCRVQIPAYYDAWMMGARYGTIEGYSVGKPGHKDALRVRLDKMPKCCLRVPSDDWQELRPVDGNEAIRRALGIGEGSGID